MAEERRTREDLIQLEYEYFELALPPLRKKELEDAEAVAARFLGVTVADLTAVSRSIHPPDILPVQILLAEEAALVDRATLTGADASGPAQWTTVDTGVEQRRVPEYVTLPLPATATSGPPLYLRAWPKNSGMLLHLQVMCRAEDEPDAVAYLDTLIRDAGGDRSPFRHRIVEFSAGQFGPAMRLVELEHTTRDQLVLTDEVWDAVHRNIDRMFARMDRLSAAGLGTNRGMILAGPPGTGKSALCRALAHEYEGRATVAIVSASAGQYVLGQLYERLDQIGPALVLIEDLDLLVGDREDHERFPLIQFLTVLDGLMTHHSRVVTVATTNDTSLIDAGAKRAARFDQVVELGLPDTATRAAILGVYLRTIDHDADVGALATASDGFSGADLREIVRSAVLDAESEDRLTHADLRVALDRRRQHLHTVSPGSYL